MNLLLGPSHRSNPRRDSDRAEAIVEQLYKNKRIVNSREIKEEVSGYDELSIIHMDLSENEYRTVDVEYLDTEKGLVCVIRVITPLGFTCYVVSPSERHNSPTLDKINPFIPREELDSILLKCGNKASGVAIRYGSRVSFNWEDKSYNFRTNSDYPIYHEIIPIITASQLQDYPTESLLVMHDQYRSVRSDQVTESTDKMEAMIGQLEQLSVNYSDLHDRAYDSLIKLKETIDPLVSTPSSESRNKELYELVEYREAIISQLESISRRSRLVEDLIKDYRKLEELVIDIE